MEVIQHSNEAQLCQVIGASSTIEIVPVMDLKDPKTRQLALHEEPGSQSGIDPCIGEAYKPLKLEQIPYI